MYYRSPSQSLVHDRGSFEDGDSGIGGTKSVEAGNGEAVQYLAATTQQETADLLERL